jgi:capsular exopolysaccharide synthesis family protein
MTVSRVARPVPVLSQAPQGESAAASIGTNWARIRSALLRYNWLIVLVTALSIAGGVFASRMLVPMYTAQATIWIDQSDRRSGANAGPVHATEVFGAEAWADLLRSYAVLEPVAQHLHLDRAFAPAASATARPYTAYDAATRLRDALQVHIDAEGNFLRLELTDTDPVRLAATLNAIAHEYVVVAANMKKQKVTDITSILANQVAYATSNLAASERALEEFRTRTATMPSDISTARGSGTAGYDGLQARREAAWRERTALERVITAPADSIAGNSELDAIAAANPNSELDAVLKEIAAKRSELRTLRMRYSDRHPLVQQAIADITTLEQTALMPQVLHMLGDVRRDEAALTGQLDTMTTALRSIPQRDEEETRLRRNVTLAEALYTMLQQRYSEAQLTNASSVSDLRVLDRAAPPERPSKNAAPRIVAMAAFGGLVFACVLAVLLDRWDKRFRYPDQVSRGLGLTILGAVPHVKPSSRTKTKNVRDQAPFQEALRDLRLNLAYAHGAAGPISFTMTSPGSSDGKSFLSMHIARIFAEGGRRTLLIDADLRRGEIHKQFPGTLRQPGLTEYLRGTALDDVLQKTGVAQVDLIAAGMRTGSAPELLGSPVMTELMSEIRARYDVIICDSPPLGAGIDAVVLGAVTGNIVLVVRAGVSQREVAESRLDVISRLPVRVLGAILNDIPENSSYRYYSHYHMAGYEALDEPAPAARALAGRG